MTTSSITPENFAKLAAFHAEIQRLHDLTQRNKEAPSQRLRDLNRTLSNDIQALSAQHEQAIAELQEKQRVEMDTLRNRDKPTRTELETSIGTIDTHFEQTSGKIRKEARPLLQGITLTEVIALIPEEVRPTLIEVADHPSKMFIIQHKLYSGYGFLIQAEEGHKTKWSVHLENLLYDTKRHYVCFCSSGCMTAESRALLMKSLSKTCNDHGIKTLLGRHASGEIDGVKFLDGVHFEKIKSGFPDNSLTNMSDRFVDYCSL